MINFRLDSKPFVNDFRFVNDYSGIILYSAIADPLFKYNSKSKKIIKYACKEYNYDINRNEWYFIIKNNLFFYDGTKVTANDYKDSLIFVILNNIFLRFLFIDIEGFTLNYDDLKASLNKSISAYGDILSIKLNKLNFHFYKNLSIINLSPIKNNITSGPFYIFKQNKKEIILKKNIYFRTNIKHDFISFKISNNRYRDIRLFKEKKLDITCNTMFPLNKVNYYKNNKEIKNFFYYENFIFFNLRIFNTNFFDKKYLLLRKAIIDLIPRDLIQKKIHYAFNDSNNLILKPYNISLFNFSEKRGLKYLHTYFNINKLDKINIKLAYDNFYPNKHIANILKETFKKYNINLELIEDDYYNNINNLYDIKLVLEYPFVLDNMFFYNLISNIKLLQNNNMDLANYLKILDSSKSNKKYRLDNFKKLNKILIKNGIIFPILKGYSCYLISDKIKKFDFRELNFNSL